MQRLVREAAKLDKSIKANDLSFSNIVKAIHAVQTEMGITGTTAEEAAKTITGAVNSMKAAWKNLLVGIADDNQDFGVLVGNFVESVVTVGKNIIPRVKTVFNGIARLVEELAPRIIDVLPSLLQDSLPSLLSGVKAIFLSIAQALPGLVSIIAQSLPTVVNDLTDVLVALFENVLPSMIGSLLSALPDVIRSLGSALQKLIPSLVESIVTVVELLAQNIGPILSAIGDVIPLIIDGINKSLKENFGDLLLGIADLIVAIVANIDTIIEPLLGSIGDVIGTICEVLISNTGVIIAAIIKVVLNIVKELPSIFGILIREIFNIGGDIAKGIWEGINGFFTGKSFGEIAHKRALNANESDDLSNYDDWGDWLTNAEPEEDIVVEIPASNEFGGTGGNNFENVSINITVPNSSASAEEIAEAVSYELQKMADERSAAHGYSS